MRPGLPPSLNYELRYDESHEAYNSLVTIYLDGQNPNFMFFEEAPNPYVEFWISYGEDIAPFQPIRYLQIGIIHPHSGHSLVN